MTQFRGQVQAFGQPGIEPRWTQGNKAGIGTAYSTSSQVWFTLWNGVITEVYHPTIDWPQLRDLQFLITDGETFFHEEKAHLQSKTERLWQYALGYRVTNSDPDGRYCITKEIIVDPHLPCVLQHTRVRGNLPNLRLYLLCAPHLEVGGWGNNAHVVTVAGRELLVAEKQGRWLAVGATLPFTRLSCGYVGESDGWTDLHDDFQMDWEFDCALDGNVALTGELQPEMDVPFTVGLAFGDCLYKAVTALLQSLDVPFAEQQKRYVEQWERPCHGLLPLEQVSTDGGNLCASSISILLAHEDKHYQGAMIASLAIPWGETKGDPSSKGSSDPHQRGYHAVWIRDLVHCALGLLAAGNQETALRSLIYLATSQLPDGSFAQVTWLNGEPLQDGVQLDQVAFPILLAWHLHQEKALRQFDPYPMVQQAVTYLMKHGPMTEQERWEQSGGYSPATLAVMIAALIAAAEMMRDRSDYQTAQFVEDYADFLESHIENWTVTTTGSLVPGISRHYIHIAPVNSDTPCAEPDPSHGVIPLPHQAPGQPQEARASEIVDAGFLELVRYGIRQADDPLIIDSLRVVDATLKVDTPFGPCWRRYSHDGYGQRADGSPWQAWGQGRSWPLLTGERGHYAIAAHQDPKPYIAAMEGFASSTGLLPEQIWDAPDLPEAHLYLGGPTGSAMPLAWAHAEYLSLLRSAKDGQLFNLIPTVAQRYGCSDGRPKALQIWSPHLQVAEITEQELLRIQSARPFQLRCTHNDWEDTHDIPAKATHLGIHYVDVPVPRGQTLPIQFTFYWMDTEQWEGRDFQVNVHQSSLTPIPTMTQQNSTPEIRLEALRTWSMDSPVETITPQELLRIQAPRPFRLRCTHTEWEDTHDATAKSTTGGVHYVDVPIPFGQEKPIRFTFYWMDTHQWEGRDFQVDVQQENAAPA